jgi:hypothetical protein
MIGGVDVLCRLGTNDSLREDKLVAVVCAVARKLEFVWHILIPKVLTHFLRL